ncbi:MAG TPA: T9SS type A sorting domain-containing protein, partial [Candidatus Cloacimonadota bacterium]|nr:T9SS type A sorting domain-containing protein [Candidatus Cloacimonadota bacterium]
LQSVNFPNNYYWAQIQTTEHPKSIAFNFTESSYLPAPERGSGGYAPVVKQLKIFPNPLVNESNIRFELLTADQTKIEVFNLRGQKVRSLVDSALPKGQQSFKWDGRDDRNRKLASGIYFIKIAQGKRSNTAKMLLLK